MFYLKKRKLSDNERSIYRVLKEEKELIKLHLEAVKFFEDLLAKTNDSKSTVDLRTVKNDLLRKNKGYIKYTLILKETLGLQIQINEKDVLLENSEEGVKIIELISSATLSSAVPKDVLTEVLDKDALSVINKMPDVRRETNVFEGSPVVAKQSIYAQPEPVVVKAIYKDEETKQITDSQQKEVNETKTVE